MALRRSATARLTIGILAAGALAGVAGPASASAGPAPGTLPTISAAQVVAFSDSTIAATTRVLTPNRTQAPQHLVSLGDSYSSGEGNPRPPFLKGTATKTDACHRSPIAYPELLVNDHSLGLDRSAYAFVACSGATRRDVWNGNVANHEPSQLNALSASTSLVTLSVGGNDVDFPGVLAHCITGGLTNLPLNKKVASSQDCRNLKVPVSNLAGAKETLDQHESRLIADLGATTLCDSPDGYITCVPSLSDLYKSIAQGSGPSARLRVLLYPHLFTTTPDARGCRLLDVTLYIPVGIYRVRKVHVTADISQRNMKWINDGVDKTDLKIMQQVAVARLAGVDIQVVDPRIAFDNGGSSSPGGHGACTRQPWIRGIYLNGFDPNPYSFHPNEIGQQQFYVAMRNAVR